jgi:hypothetical protein
MKNVSKNIFLNAMACPTLGWMVRSDVVETPPLTAGERFRSEQGMEVGRRARELFPGGRFIPPGDMVIAAERTAAVLRDASVATVFEAAFLDDGFSARADILERDDAQWHLIEVKSAVTDREEFVDDMTYTLAVMRHCGVQVSRVSLMLVSRDYRLGMPDEDLFAVVDHTEDVAGRAAELEPLWRGIEESTRAPERPEPRLILDCRRCGAFPECLGKGVDNHIFDFPRLSRRRFDELDALGIESIDDVPAGIGLSEYQERVRDCVTSGQPYVADGLGAELAAVVWPAHYLDFETVMTAIPLYPGVGPYQQVVTQFSVHRCSDVGAVIEHREYLADPATDCRRELAERLLDDLGTAGSIVVYSGFERAVINGLSALFPDLAERLLRLTDRLVDLEAIIRRGYYHPDFRGSTSIKRTLPVLVPDMSYEGLDIADGESAAAAFARMAQGHDPDEMTTRGRLLEYCEQDTMAMVRLHAALAAEAAERAEQR